MANSTTKQNDDSKQRPWNRLLFGGTLAVATILWLMFELLRTPYAPPRDMLTLLGTEKYTVVGVMAFIAAIWMIFTFVILITARLTLKELLSYIGLICVILAFYMLIFKNPLRAVTPWELMWS